MSAWLRFRLVADRFLAAALLALCAPVIGVCAALVRRHDGGPALITVPRVGRHGRPFRMWKVRTMRAESANGRAGGLGLTTADDHRVTPVGGRLRAHHLDELPQLYNVVRGDMGLLGPRPEAPEFVDRAEQGWAAVLAAAPGLAGPTQLVVGRWERDMIAVAPDGSAYTDEVVPVKLAIDRWYVERASPGLDALVAFTLLSRFVPRARTRRLVDRVRREVPEGRAVGV